MDSEAIREILAQYTFTYRDELELHDALEAVLSAAGADVRREVSTNVGRIDMIVDRVAIEVKVSGAASAVRRQLVRYTGCPDINEVLLVTNRPRHRACTGDYQGVPIAVLVLC